MSSTPQQEQSLDDLITASIVGRKDQIVAGMIEQAESSLRQSLGWRTNEAVSEALGKFMTEEVLPEVGVRLREKKGEIVEAIIAGLDQVFADLGSTLAKKAANNLTGYKGNEILKKLFD